MGVLRTKECVFIHMLYSDDIHRRLGFRVCRKLALRLMFMQQQSKYSSSGVTFRVSLQDPYPTRSIESLDLMESMFLWLLRYGGKQDVAAEQKLVNERQQVSAQSPDDSASSPQKGSPSRAEGRADPGTPGSITGGISGFTGGISGFTGGEPQPQVLISELWLSMLQAFARISLEANEHLRNHAVVILHR